MNPALTVVIPCRDAEAFVGATIEHVLGLADDAGVAVELIVVDDGSTDATRAVASSLPVRLVAQDARGVAAARNTGIAHARAPVVGMLDADDRWTAAVFGVLLPMVGAGSEPPIAQGRVRDLWPDLGLGPPYELCSLGAALFRAEVFDRVGPMDESFHRLEDYEWFVRAYDHRVPKVRVPDTVLHYLRRPDGLTGSAPPLDPVTVRVHRAIMRRRATEAIPRDVGFPTVGEYLGVVPPESERRPVPPSGLRRLDARPVDPTATVPGFAVVRNERVRIPALLDHHRRLGVGAFFVVDNDSTDGTAEYLLGQPDVHLWQTSDSFAAARYGTDWLLALMEEHAGDGWRLVVDADELFVYLGYEHTPIDALCAQLDAEGADALLAVMVDVYGAGAIADTTYEPGQDPLAVCPWFDRRPWTHSVDGFWEHRSHPSYFGGARRRVFGAPDGADPDTYYTVNKVPLFRATATARPSPSFHWLDGARVSRGRAALLHWKYIADFGDAARREAARGEHWDGASQPRRYAAGLEGAADLSMYDPRRSVRFVDSAQLGRLGILSAVGAGSGERSA